MARFMSIPPEILDRVFSHADLTTRKNLRCSSHALSAVGQRWVFDSLTFTPTDASCNRLDRIISSPAIAKCVTMLYINTWNLDNEFDSDYFQDEGNHQPNTNLSMRLWNAFHRMKELPSLESLVLRFHDACGETELDNPLQPIAVRVVILTRFLSAVAALPRPLRELGLLDFQMLLGSLRVLRLDVTNATREGSPYVYRCYSKLPRVWLKPTMANLEHLTLYSRLLVGFCPKLDLRGLHFPRLKSLSLGNYAFMRDYQLDWILSHGSSLIELYMDHCTIIYEAALYFNVDGATPVSETVLSSQDFHPHPDLNDLPHLRHFQFGSTLDRWTNRVVPFNREIQTKMGFYEECYMVFCDGTLWAPYMRKMMWRLDKNAQPRRKDKKPLIPSEDDRRALVELCAKVGQSLKLHEEEFLEPE
ncbi:hypothetical protein BDW74DRAFT_169735 [Aspergillus multicolor]|uniref:uncharacterized protein n=1 Tax=Aspergillus multicolor TaxID=41759 RepID=UPI003CCD82B6